jgi:aspartyl-tRNA synthetase
MISYLGKEDRNDPAKVKLHETVRSLKDWTPVLVSGTVASRKDPSKESTAMGIPLANNVEMQLHNLQVLNEVPSDLLLKDDTVFAPEQRHLQLRTDADLRENLLFRSQVTKTARNILDKLGFTEVETPVLFKSTPEGAREFLVPTRTKGLAYALPQSPQQYKQILMASGITKYFQFARCFRDEDLRADRQPEFTQLDMEMSFMAEHDVMARIERLLSELWETCLSHKIDTPFQRMTYHEAMSSYGSDKPDLRLGSEVSVTYVWANTNRD